jgi:hypothetical protein
MTRARRMYALAALSSGLLAAGSTAPLFCANETVAIVAVERFERCVSASRMGPPREPGSRDNVFLQLELRGSAVEDPYSLTPETVRLRSDDSRWRPKSVAIGVPAGDPLGVRRRGPLLLFEVPRASLSFLLKVGGEPELRLDPPCQYR